MGKTWTCSDHHLCRAAPEAAHSAGAAAWAGRRTMHGKQNHFFSPTQLIKYKTCNEISGNTYYYTVQ